MPTRSNGTKAAKYMEPKLFKYIWHHSKREQSAILFLVVLSLPFYFISLDLPKSIVNKGIQGEGFVGAGSTQSFLRFDWPFGAALSFLVLYTTFAILWLRATLAGRSKGVDVT